jgi:CHAT domain-containing protein
MSVTARNSSTPQAGRGEAGASFIRVRSGRRRWPNAVHHGLASPSRGATATSRRATGRSSPAICPRFSDELKAVAGKLGAAAADVHLGSAASETVVKRPALANYRVMYFATHGLVAGGVAGLREPSLALTLQKQPTELDDGLLTASEVAQLKLNADWVALSACNTAAADKPGRIEKAWAALKRPVLQIQKTTCEIEK